MRHADGRATNGGMFMREEECHVMCAKIRMPNQAPSHEIELTMDVSK